MRAISSTRPAASSGATVASVPPAPASFATRSWCARERGHLRQVGDAEDLVVARELGEERPHDLRHAPADAGVDFVEDERRDAGAPAHQDLDGERQPRELAAGGDLAHRAGGLPGVGGDAELDAFQAAGGRLRLGLEDDLEPAALHGKALQAAGDFLAEPAGGVPPLRGERAGRLAEGRPGRALALAQRLEAFVAADFRQPRAAGGERIRKPGRFDAHPARRVVDVAQPPVERVEALGIGLDALQVAAQLVRGFARVGRGRLQVPLRLREVGIHPGCLGEPRRGAREEAGGARLRLVGGLERGAAVGDELLRMGEPAVLGESPRPSPPA